LGKIGAELRKSIDRIAAKERVINKQVSPSMCIISISHARALILMLNILYSLWPYCSLSIWGKTSVRSKPKWIRFRIM